MPSSQMAQHQDEIWCSSQELASPRLAGANHRTVYNGTCHEAEVVAFS